MKLLNKCLFFVALLPLLSSCASEAPWDDVAGGKGSIRLDIQASSDVKSEAPSVRSSSEVVLPPVDQFSVRLTKPDGSVQTWTSLRNFAEEASFPAGKYQLEAIYGHDAQQGFVKDDEEGYEHAYYYGLTENIEVREGQDTKVSVTPRLANSIVYIEYTPEFKKYFKDWDISFRTDGKESVNMGHNEGMSYIIPGNVGITFKATQQNGQEVTLNASSFEAQPKTMYKMKYNIYNGEIGDAKLQILFDDSLEVDPIEINLSEELGMVASPVVTPVGFTSGQEFEHQSGTVFANPVKFDVLAKGGIKEAKLNIASDSYHPDFMTNNAIDLCAATPAQQSALAMAGVKALGFYNNPGQSAQLDVTDLFKTFPIGTHEISLQVTDKFGNTHEAVAFKANCFSIEMSIKSGTAVFGNGYADVIISYNGPDATEPGKNPFTFTTKNENGIEEPCAISSINGVAYTSTRAYESKDYAYRIAIPYRYVDEFDVNLQFNNSDKGKITIPYEYPSFEIESDALAKSIRFRINGWTEGTTKAKLIHRRLQDMKKAYLNGSEIVLTDDGNGIFSISNVNPATEYTLQASLKIASTSAFDSSTKVTTEEAAKVPHWDFTHTKQTININPINAGGQYKYLTSTYQNTTSITVNELDGWASINSKTCYAGSSVKNTWFMVPSTLVKNNEVIIRSVAYDHAGKMPDVYNFGVKVEQRYSHNKPSSIANKAAGELFLGEYSYTSAGESREEGVSFANRPSGISFDYTYSAVNNEVGFAYIVLLDKDGNVITDVEKDLSNVSSATKITLSFFNDKFPSYKFKQEVSKLLIKFISTKGKDITAPFPSDLDDTEGKSGHNLSINPDSYKSLCVGSVLSISNLKFEY